MPVPNSVNKHDRYAVYNANLAKNPNITTDYPRMLTSPDDGTTTIVHDAKAHKNLVGSTKFEKDPLWGPPNKTKAAPQSETTTVDNSTNPWPNEVAVPEATRLRKGLRTKSLDGNAAAAADLVPAQTVFDNHLPDPEAVIKNPSLSQKPSFQS